MNTPSTKRFVTSAILMSLGWLSFLWMDTLPLLLFFSAWLVAVPHEQLHRVVPRRELLWMACVLVAFVAAIVASKILVPQSADRALERFFRHPAVIIPLWLLCLWLGFRGWRSRIHEVARP
jgi:hypothetical protein